MNIKQIISYLMYNINHILLFPLWYFLIHIHLYVMVIPKKPYDIIYSPLFMYILAYITISNHFISFYKLQKDEYKPIWMIYIHILGFILIILIFILYYLGGGVRELQF